MCTLENCLVTKTTTVHFNKDDFLYFEYKLLLIYVLETGYLYSSGLSTVPIESYFDLKKLIVTYYYGFIQICFIYF